MEFRTLIDEAKIVVDSAYVALDRLKDTSEIDAVRHMLKEADELLALLKLRSRARSVFSQLRLWPLPHG